MKTAEQKSRDMLERMDVDNAQSMTAGDVVELANLIRKSDLAKKQIRSARKLFDRTMDVIPDFSDGRNDKLTDAIEAWLESTE